MNAIHDPRGALLHMGARFRWLATARETGGAFAIAEIEVRAGAEPPPHTHAHEEETFYVVDGEVEFRLEGVSQEAGPGDLVVLPRGRAHAFRVKSETARMLLMVTPPGLEEAFIETSKPAPDNNLPPIPEGPPPREVMERLIAIHGARGIRFEPDFSLKTAPPVAQP
jgi:quercetin dioxygenase-like cupin family protein